MASLERAIPTGATIAIANDVGWARVIERADLSMTVVRLDDHA